LKKQENQKITTLKILRGELKRIENSSDMLWKNDAKK